ncbi:uncharacterized protein [Dysidea avara]
MTLIQVLLASCHTCNIKDNRVSLNVHFSNKSCSEFYLENGIFNLEESNETNTFNSANSIKVIGKEGTTIQCKYNAGLSFNYVSNIVLQNITFHNCGMKFNSTSVNPDHPNNTTLISKVALLFEYCHNLTLSFVTIENSSGVGIQIYNTIGDVSISHCNFVGNKILFNETGKFSGGGGVYIEFSLCQPGTIAIDCKDVELNYNSHTKYTIKYSNFTLNNATTTNPERTAFIRAGNHTHIAFGRGGGLSVYLKGNASYHTFTILNCTFTENSALYGAGMFIELQDSSNHNNFSIKNSHFELNKIFSKRLGFTGTSGGGAMLDYNIFNNNNEILYNSVAFINTVFESNFAFTGGGFSFHSSKETGVLQPTNHLRFTNCLWHKNEARLGAAVDLSIWHSAENGQLVKPLFGNCRFESNMVSGYEMNSKLGKYAVTDVGSNTSSGGYWPGIGIMYLDGITVDFSHDIQFFNNTGSAIAAISAGINLHSNAVVSFTNNSGNMGGALYLSGYSWISASPNVQVLFINNSANLGGAIYAQKSGEHDLVSTANCFIRYIDNIASPDKWKNVSFNFTDNCASTDNGGDAIYTTTVVDCAWDGSFNVVDNSTLRNVFLNWTNFEFITSNDICSNFIQTSARSFKSSTNHLKVAPGETFPFPFEAQNDFGNTTPTIFAVFSNDRQVEIPNPVVQTDGSSLFKTNNTNDSFYLQFVTVDRRRHVGYVNVSVEDCPMGFHVNNGTCVCTSAKFEGLSCDSRGLHIQPGYWAGEIENGFLSIYSCPMSYCKYMNSTILLNLKHRNDSDALCNNRIGRLCGNCSFGHGLEIGTLDCVKCKGSHYTAWTIYITTTYIPITIVFVLLLVLNINLAVGPIHSFILFCQIFPAITMESNHWENYNDALQVITNIYNTIINVMSLKFDVQFSTRYCLSSKMTVMDYYLLQYFAALYPLLIMVIMLSVIRYCPGCIPIKYFWHSIRRCVMAIRRRTSMQQTVIHGFITFLLLTYANFVNISFQILSYATFEDKTGGQSPVYVPFKLGTMKYFGKQHFPYALTALTFLLLFGILPPLLLTIYPVILSIIGHFGWDNTDTVRTLRRWIPLYKLMPVFDVFWSEFKPNCHMFAGFYFVYRFLVFAVESLAPKIDQIYFGLTILFVIMLFLHAFIQPYKKKTYNQADIFMFSLRIIINSFYAFSEQLRTEDALKETIQTYLWIQTILSLIPFVVIVSYVVYKIRKAHKRGYTMILDPHIDDDETAEEMAYEALFNRIDGNDGGHQDDNDD